MTVHYQVRIRNTSGTLVAVLDEDRGFRRLGYSHALNGRGNYALEVNAQDASAAYLTTDATVEIWRSDPEASIAWYKEFEGLHRTPVYQLPESGLYILTSYGFDLNDLLRRRFVLYKADHARATQTGPGETCMKNLVKQNCGSDATVAGGRIRDGQYSGFTVQTDGAKGTTWTGSRSYKRLLDVLQEIASASALDFKVISTAGATFEFRTYWPQYGSDRSLLGVDTYTGKNAAGNVPVILEVETGTMQGPTYSYNRGDEKNVIIVAGQGETEQREIATVEDTDLSDDSPWNDIEEVYNGSSEETTDGLTARGNEQLEKMKPRISFSFDVAQQPGLRYGRDYFLGDIISARFFTLVEMRLKIVGASVAYDDGVEDIKLEFKEL